MAGNSQSEKNRVVVTDDWTRNWQARIAIKITAMFLWVIILGGFATVVFFTSDLETRIEQNVARELDAMAYRLQTLLVENRAGSDPAMQESVADLFSSVVHRPGITISEPAGILGARLSLAGEVIEFGESGDHLQSAQRVLSLPGVDAGEHTSARLEAYFLPSRQSTEQTRQRLILTVVAILLLFGMLLSLTIQNVLAKPFQVLMDAIQSVSNGDLDVRMDVAREDEFGHLSRFFNRMLDQVKSQQKKLTEANRELKNEVLVRKQAEQQLMAHRDQLEQIVEERTRDLEVARDQALEASQTKSSFIANMSHEIRTPLTPIIGFAEAMLQGEWDETAREQSLRTIIRNGRHLSDIINEILDLSKIEANCLEIESISVDTFSTLNDVATLAQTMAREKGLEFELGYRFPVPRTFTGDPTRIKQILMNLVTNAVKFTERGFVRIEVSFDAENGQLALAVSDSGVGIPADKVDRLFHAFSQADSSTTRKYGGTGLGLFISKRLANMMGGDISFESVMGVGTRFVTVLPTGIVAESEYAHSAPHSGDDDLAELQQLQQLRLTGKVLLAEDSEDIQRLMKYYLQRAGIEVSTVENGKQAVESVRQSTFNLVLMDMQMPVMGGEEAVRLLRASGCRIPILALTANAMKEDRERYRAIGCDGFLGKPVDQARLYRELGRFLNRNSMTGQADGDCPVDGFEAIVAEFIAGLGEYATNIEAAFDKGDRERVRELAHQLKGMGGSFGYSDISQFAADLESAIKNRQHHLVSDRYRELLKVLRLHAGRKHSAQDDLVGEV